MTQEQLNEIIESHQHYLKKDIDGWENMRADLSHQDLRGLNLSRKDLQYAIFCNANLRRANLFEADLRNADLRRANMYRAFCCYANMYGADLRNADLREANLRGADLRRANIYGADLRNANLSGSNLSGANLCRANLKEANLGNAKLCGTDFNRAKLLGTDFRGADLRGAKLQNVDMDYVKISERTKSNYPLACPETGSFIGYKKTAYGYIAKLQICKDAKRSSATTKKCRCSKALVLAIENMDGSDSGLQEVPSIYDFSFIYHIGEIVEAPDFDDNRWHECTPGIHFFMDRQDAVEYDLLNVRPSFKDLTTFLDEPKVKFSIIACHDGDIYVVSDVSPKILEEYENYFQEVKTYISDVKTAQSLTLSHIYQKNETLTEKEKLIKFKHLRKEL